MIAKKFFAFDNRNIGAKVSKNIASEIKRIISLQQQAIQNEDLSSAKIREDRIQRAIHLISSNKEKIVEALQDDFGYKDRGGNPFI